MTELTGITVNEKAKLKVKPKVKPAPPHQHRMCIACRGVAAKEELLRLRIADGQVLADERQIGRGCYVHPVRICLSKLKEAHRLQHAFKSSRAKAGRDKTEKDAQIKIDMGSVHRIIAQVCS